MGKTILKIIGRVLAVLLSTIIVLALFLWGVVLVMCKGPSEQAARLFVLSTGETSALKWVPRLALSEETIEEIRTPEANETEQDTWVELENERGVASSEEQAAETAEPAEENAATVQDGIEIIDIRGSTWQGKMMIIHDPTRVFIGTLSSYGGQYGMYLDALIEKYGAVGGTNAGGFDDPNGTGDGGTPDGLVIRDGTIVWGSAGTYYCDVIGFEADGTLHVGNMTGQAALNLGVVTGVSFTAGPVLIQDGIMQTGLGGGLNPRTVIGQREDGAVLLAVIQGRRPESLGATYDDLAEMMFSYGCINAANLDGGSSSQMIYEGETVVRGSNLLGMRRLATAILIKPEEEVE